MERRRDGTGKFPIADGVVVISFSYNSILTPLSVVYRITRSIVVEEKGIATAITTAATTTPIRHAITLVSNKSVLAVMTDNTLPQPTTTTRKSRQVVTARNTKVQTSTVPLRKKTPKIVTVVLLVL
jgi:hypothetical protein